MRVRRMLLTLEELWVTSVVLAISGSLSPVIARGPNKVGIFLSIER